MTTNRFRQFINRKTFTAGAGAAAAASLAPIGARAVTAFAAKCGADTQPTHTVTLRATEMFKTIEQETNGAVKIQFFANSALGSSNSMVQQMRAGALEFMFCSGTTLGGLAPICTIENVAFAFKDSKEGLAALDGPLGQYIRKQVADAGVYAFDRVWDSGSLQMTAGAHPIRTPDDLVGLKVRVPNARVLVDLFTTLGAVPSPVDLAEAYAALQTHLVDALSLTLGGMETGHFYEVQKYLSLTSHSWTSYYMLAGGDTWTKIPPDVKAVITRNAVKFALLQRADNIAADAGLATKLGQQGLAVNRPDQAPFRAKLGPHYARFKAAFGDTAWALLEKTSGKLG